MAKWVWLVGLALSIMPLSARAQFVSGNELLQSCESQAATPADIAQFAQCAGYIQGVSDTIDQIARVRNVSRCIPTGTAVRQLIDAVVIFLRAHPANRDEPASGLVAAAFTMNWHCNFEG